MTSNITPEKKTTKANYWQCERSQLPIFNVVINIKKNIIDPYMDLYQFRCKKAPALPAAHLVSLLSCCDYSGRDGDRVPDRRDCWASQDALQAHGGPSPRTTAEQQQPAQHPHRFLGNQRHRQRPRGQQRRWARRQRRRRQEGREHQQLRYSLSLCVERRKKPPKRTQLQCFRVYKATLEVPHC